MTKTITYLERVWYDTNTCATVKRTAQLQDYTQRSGYITGFDTIECERVVIPISKVLEVIA